MVQSRAIAVELFRNAHHPSGQSAETAWLSIYQVLMWYVDVHIGHVTQLPHIIEANNLRPPAGQLSTAATLNIWARRAQAVEAYLAQHLRCQPSEVPEYLDQLMRHPAYQGRQRQNPLGSAFPALIKYVLEQFGNDNVHYRLEVSSTEIFPGIAIPGRSVTPKVDIVRWTPLLRQHEG